MQTVQFTVRYNRFADRIAAEWCWSYDIEIQLILQAIDQVAKQRIVQTVQSTVRYHQFADRIAAEWCWSYAIEIQSILQAIGQATIATKGADSAIYLAIQSIAVGLRRNDACVAIKNEALNQRPVSTTQGTRI